MYCHDYEYKEWLYKNTNTVPTIQFDADMKVQLLPPFGGALVRMRVNGFSIYLDIDRSLGCEDNPYWELYDHEECHRFDMNDINGLLNKIRECTKHILNSK